MAGGLVPGLYVSGIWRAGLVENGGPGTLPSVLAGHVGFHYSCRPDPPLRMHGHSAIAASASCLRPS